MKLWLLLISDIGALERDVENLRLKCSRHFDRDFLVYQPLPFVDHTGFTESVADEISFVIGSQASTGNAILSKKAFVETWGLGPFMGKRVVDLSGGWRKYLSIALFSNQRATAKLYVDSNTHLSDGRLGQLLTGLEVSRLAQDVVFAEYDPDLFRRIYPTFELLIDVGDRVEPAAPTDQSTDVE